MLKIARKVMSKETGKKRKRITLSMKIKVSYVIEIGTSYTVISKHCGMRD